MAHSVKACACPRLILPHPITAARYLPLVIRSLRTMDHRLSIASYPGASGRSTVPKRAQLSSPSPVFGSFSPHATKVILSSSARRALLATGAISAHHPPGSQPHRIPDGGLSSGGPMFQRIGPGGPVKPLLPERMLFGNGGSVPGKHGVLVDPDQFDEELTVRHTKVEIKRPALQSFFALGEFSGHNVDNNLNDIGPTPESEDIGNIVTQARAQPLRLSG